MHCVHMKSEVNVSCFSQLLPYLLFETESLTKLGANSAKLAVQQAPGICLYLPLQHIHASTHGFPTAPNLRS